MDALLSVYTTEEYNTTQHTGPCYNMKDAVQVVDSLPGLRLSLNKVGGRVISAGMLSNDVLVRSSKPSGNRMSSPSSSGSLRRNPITANTMSCTCTVIRKSVLQWRPRLSSNHPLPNNRIFLYHAMHSKYHGVENSQLLLWS